MKKTAILFFKKKFLNLILPFFLVSSFLGSFYYFTAPMLMLDVQNSREAGLLWGDEAFHLKSIERMQSEQTWELLHSAYTAFYTNLSYAISWLTNGMSGEIPTVKFIMGSRWASYLCIQSTLVVVFCWLFKLLNSWKWAFLGMCFVGMQRGIYFFAITMHPEPPMLLGIVISIFAATEFILRPRFIFLFLLSFGLALAISSKLQAFLLLPWAGIILILGKWIGRIRIYTLFRWSIGSLFTLLFGLFLLTPYQIIHLQRLWDGIQEERKRGALGGWDTNTDVNLLDWINYALSNELVGYSYTLLILIAIFIFVKQISICRKNLREWLSKPISALFLTNLIWVVIGAGYIFIAVESLIARYLIHVVPSLMLISFLGVYWSTFFPKKLAHYVWLIILVILVSAGLQQQTKHASFDFKVRKRIADRFVHVRQIVIDLKKIVPKESKILNPLGYYVDSKWFVNASHEQPTSYLLRQFKMVKSGDKTIEYLLMSESYPDSLKREGVSLEGSKNSPEYREKINFWKALVENGINGRFKILRQYPKARLTLYRRVYQLRPSNFK